MNKPYDMAQIAAKTQCCWTGSFEERRATSYHTYAVLSSSLLGQQAQPPSDLPL